MQYPSIITKIFHGWAVCGLILIVAVSLGAKCPTGSVVLSGTVNNLPSGGMPVDATVSIETSKGIISRSVPLSKNEFRIEIPFSTRSSSFLGDRCNTVPSFVDIKIHSERQVHVQRRLSFKDNFEMTGLHQYRLKHELVLDVAKTSTIIRTVPRVSKDFHAITDGIS